MYGTQDSSDLLWGYFFTVLFFAALFGAIGAWIGGTKDRRTAGFWLGFWLGPIGLIIIAVLERPSSYRYSPATQTYNHRNKREESSSKREKAIVEAIRRDPGLTADTPEALASLDLAADAIEAEWETRRIRDEAIASTEGEWSGGTWVVKPDGVTSEWNGTEWVIKPEGVTANWNGKAWLQKPDSGVSEWNGMEWVIRPADATCEWSGETWVMKPDGVTSEWNGTEWVIKPEGVTANWNGKAWLEKPSGVESEWLDTMFSGQKWVIKPQGFESRWNGREWVPRPKGPANWDEGRRRWTRPWYAEPLNMGLVALVLLCVVLGAIWWIGVSQTRAQEKAALEPLKGDEVHSAMSEINSEFGKESVSADNFSSRLTAITRKWEAQNPESKLDIRRDWNDEVLLIYNPKTEVAECLDLPGSKDTGRVRVCQPEDFKLTGLPAPAQ